MSLGIILSWLHQPHNNNPDEKVLGKKLMDVTYNNLEGTPVSLLSFSEEYLLLNFWATWCEPCKRELPDLNTFQNKHRNVLKIVAISLDSLERSTFFMKAINNTLLTLISDQEVFNIMASLGNSKEAIPYSVLLNKNREIIYTQYGEVSLSKITDLIHEENLSS
ncbi:MAG: TlpA disulfide reductase family protein [Methylacidiphilales bacterium]|nr:TlpA disulfide reductase family protein [Candidatus Methylacidiphilales bacterium]